MSQRPSSHKSRPHHPALFRRALIPAIILFLLCSCLLVFISFLFMIDPTVRPAAASVSPSLSPPFSSGQTANSTYTSSFAFHNSSTTVASRHHTVYVPLTVPLILQNPELPTGCEVTAAAMLLGAYGYEVDKTYLASLIPRSNGEKRGGRTYAPHPQDGFLGDPFTVRGYGVFPQALVAVCQKTIDYEKGPETVKALQNAAAADILALIDQGKPVCVWTTQDLLPIVYRTGWYIQRDGIYTDEYFQWPGNEHCMVLIGYDDYAVFVQDPMKGTARYDRPLFFQRFQEMGGYALFLAN